MTKIHTDKCIDYNMKYEYDTPGECICDDRIPLEDKDIFIVYGDDEVLKSETGTCDVMFQKGMTDEDAEQLKIQILDDYELHNEFSKMIQEGKGRSNVSHEWLTELQEKADLHDQLIKILIQHCGEDGDNEGAVDTLKRIIEKAEKWDKYNKSYWSLKEKHPKLEQEIKQLKEEIVDLKLVNHTFKQDIIKNKEIVQKVRELIKRDEAGNINAREFWQDLKEIMKDVP